MDGWKTIVSFWDGLFSIAMLASGRVVSEGYPELFTVQPPAFVWFRN